MKQMIDNADVSYRRVSQRYSSGADFKTVVWRRLGSGCHGMSTLPLSTLPFVPLLYQFHLRISDIRRERRAQEFERLIGLTLGACTTLVPVPLENQRQSATVDDSGEVR